jgi:hypothetical protein
VQDACNLSGVVHSFSKAMEALSEIANNTGQGSEWKNSHPVAVLFSSKIASLTRSEDMPTFTAAYKVVYDQVRAAKNGGQS